MDVNAAMLWDIFKHTTSWLVNLDRGSRKRKEQSVKALRDVVIASRETATYIRQMSDTGHREHGAERHLSMLWTSLGYALEDVGNGKLAKRCQIKGKHWSNPAHYDKTFLKKADVSLERMERLSNEMLQQLGR